MTEEQLVPRRWRDDFILALRLRDAAGAQIGDALAQVESYCAESGDTAAEAFGDAREYAQALPLAPGPVAGPAVAPGQLARIGIAVTGMLTTFAAASGWAAGAATVTAGQVVSVALVLVGAVLVIRMIDAVTRLITTAARSFWLGLAVVLPVLGVNVAVVLLLDQPLVEIPAEPMLAVGLVLVLAPSIWETLSGVAVDADVVAGPFDDPEDVHRKNARSAKIATWIIPIMTAPAALLFALAAALR
ncbi:hypothetical protein [Cellulomonas chengniuliangii]|uniref:Uncharacterized protein n=1 Tax=Cellulomonas chengniuliangii TaxID=2968084 RepID=A0ABY5L0A2_9CELL|nr:hypothetical protein [Cellulomonas chengniuliangii]MCC2307856.1 hypothetical protein [Cellulomonas chengniuliangii]MCC2318373.1 hypothetical protein [Cellulomonas chengniuliangii]UUI75390.1 hypothetical protein NP064_00195 [Cellulomonas chengniuliangii]